MAAAPGAVRASGGDVDMFKTRSRAARDAELALVLAA
jgi:hypothetical protein